MVEDSLEPMGYGTTRSAERIAASLHQADTVKIQFATGCDISNGGVLLSLPALLANGLLKNVEKLFSLPQGYYQSMSIFILMGFSALLRVKNVEGLRSCSPGEFGKILGLDRIPEVKTLREKLEIISQKKKANDWSIELSKSWLGSSDELSGVLYVDGHVRVYHGSNANLPKQYVSRERLCMPGITDYWVNDILGQPFFYVSSVIKEGMLKILKEKIIPRLLEEIPNQPTEEDISKDKYKSRFGIVFDREGYSPSFIAEMWEKRIICYTYKKYATILWEEEEFIEFECSLPTGEKVKMKLAERGIFLDEKIWVREIRKLTTSGHQTSLITTDYKNKSSIIAVLMFARWSQENFFKYMAEHFGIDRLVEYGTEILDETKKVVNPEYKNIDSSIKINNGKLKNKLSEFGRMNLSSEELEENKMQEFESSKSKLREDILDFEKTITDLKIKRSAINKHIDLSEMPENIRYSGLLSEKKHIMDLIKMIAYRAETGMVSILKEVMGKPEDARSLLRAIYQTEVDLKPDEKNNILNVAVHNLNNKSTDTVVKYLCDKLNETDTIFPGTNLRLMFKLVSN